LLSSVLLAAPFFFVGIDVLLLLFVVATVLARGVVFLTLFNSFVAVACMCAASSCGAVLEAFLFLFFPSSPPFNFNHMGLYFFLISSRVLFFFELEQTQTHVI